MPCLPLSLMAECIVFWQIKLFERVLFLYTNSCWLLGYLPTRHLSDLDSLHPYQCIYVAGSAVICVLLCCNQGAGIFSVLRAALQRLAALKGGAEIKIPLVPRL